ncbi:ABC transporter permease [Vibrio chagasii]|nr:ABC transporter permease [Vibrio chagasii]
MRRTAVWDERISVSDRGIWQKPPAVTTDFASMTNLIPNGWRTLAQSMIKKRCVKSLCWAIHLLRTCLTLLKIPALVYPCDTQTNPVGEKVKIGSEEFTVIGVLKKNSAA